MKTFPLLIICFCVNVYGQPPIKYSGVEKKQKIQQISTELLTRYTAPEDSLKRMAAEYLLAGLSLQWHYNTQVLEEFGRKELVSDVKEIDADYLAENIDYAFKAWELPWAKDVSFEDFCRYLLPYKMGNEAPERWRAAVWKEYESLRLDALSEDRVSPSEVCRRVIALVREWYTFHYNENYPVDAGYLKAKELRSGTCIGASLMILYPLRALGICATYDHVPFWGNRSGEHAWNALYEKGQLIPFSSIDLEPGKAKQEFIGVGRMIRKRPKILRKDYQTAAEIDVTSEYIPTADLSIRDKGSGTGEPQLLIFDNKSWRNLSVGTWKGHRAEFTAMARDVAYLPVARLNGKRRALSWPFVVEQSGRLKVFRPRSRKQTVHLTAKYPEDESNAIFPGEHYELFYWRNGWKSLGIQEAADTILDYQHVPKGALLWLRNLDKGNQERIFSYENGKQVWY